LAIGDDFLGQISDCRPEGLCSVDSVQLCVCLWHGDT